MDLRAHLRQLLEELPRERLPEACGALAEAQALLQVRLSEPHLNGAQPSNEVQALDNYLSVSEVAERLSTSDKWAYRHAEELGAVHLSSGTVRFPERALQRYLTARSLR